MASNPLDKQEGGDHYKSWAIQPVEFLQKNSASLDWCQSNIIKYVCRFRDKNGLEDLKKAQHYLELLLHFEYAGAGMTQKLDLHEGIKTNGT